MTEQIIVYILSLPRSGSSLLGHVLGSHARAVHIGETVAPLRKGMPVQCRACGAGACPLWGTAVTEPLVKKIYRDFQRYQTAPRLKNSWETGWVFPKPGNSMPLSFQASEVVRISSTASKNIAWAIYNSRSRLYAHRFIFLRRDIRACWAAYKRSYPARYREQLDPFRSKAEKLDRLYDALPPRERYRLCYESEVRRICQFLGLPFAVEMLNFYEYPHHVIGGHAGLAVQCQRAQDRPVENMFSGESEPEFAIMPDIRKGLFRMSAGRMN